MQPFGVWRLAVVGAGAASSVLVGAGAVLSLVGIINSDAVKNLYNRLAAQVIDRYFKNTPDAAYPEHWLAPDLQLVPFDMITSVYSGNVAAVHWTLSSNSVTASRAQFVEDPDSGASAGSGAGVWYGGGGTVPVIITLPDGPVARIDIGLLEFPVPSQDSYGCCSGSQDGYV